MVAIGIELVDAPRHGSRQLDARQRLLAWLVVGATTWSAVLVLASHTVLGWLFT